MRCWIVLMVILFGWNSTVAQRAVFSEPDREDTRQMAFEIIGRLGSNIHVYKGDRNNHFISLFDMNMKQVKKHKLDFIPEKVFNIDFLAYRDYYLMFYQFQRKNIVYAMGVRMDADGKRVGEPVVMDTTQINYSASNKIYSVINSEDKEQILVFKISKKLEKQHTVSVVHYNKNLVELNKDQISIAMPDRNDQLTGFEVDNRGNLVFMRTSSTLRQENAINKLSLIIKPAESSDAASIRVKDVEIKSMFLDDVHLKIDNQNKNLIITALFTKVRRGNIDGIFNYVFDSEAMLERASVSTVFDEQLRNDSKSDNSLKTAFNEFYLKNIVVRKDGGFIVAAESMYTNSRGANGPISRWDMMAMGGPMGMMTPMDFYMWNGGWGMNPWMWNSPMMWGSPWGMSPWMMNPMWGRGAQNVNRFYADNVAVLSFDANGKMEWGNVIRKSQFDDNSDNRLYYGLANTGDKLHFIFNIQDRRDWVMIDQSIDGDGQITRNPSIKNLDKGFDFMPRYARQIGARQIIVPFMHRNYLCFLRLEI